MNVTKDNKSKLTCPNSHRLEMMFAEIQSKLSAMGGRFNSDTRDYKDVEFLEKWVMSIKIELIKRSQILDMENYSNVYNIKVYNLGTK